MSAVPPSTTSVAISELDAEGIIAWRENVHLFKKAYHPPPVEIESTHPLYRIWTKARTEPDSMFYKDRNEYTIMAVELEEQGLSGILVRDEYRPAWRDAVAYYKGPTLLARFETSPAEDANTTGAILGFFISKHFN